MTRRLTFDGPKAQDRFKFCLLAILMGGDGRGERNRDILRKEARLLDALEAVSVEDKSVTQAERRICEGVQVVTLDQDDHSLLQKYLDGGAWLPAVARQAVDAQDFVDSADKID